MYLRGATYPLELLNDAVFLRDQAIADHERSPPDERGIPGPRQRAFSRAAIFTSFNFLEGLLIELSQEDACNGALKGTQVARDILQDLSDGKASISRTMKEWPLALRNVDVIGRHQFRYFKEIRGFRNQLIHVKFEPLNSNQLTQDELLRRADVAETAWVLGQICIMAEVLYQVFGRAVPTEVAQQVANAPIGLPMRS